MVGDVSHTQKDISLVVDKAKRERGWVTILHPGWSAPTCGKTQYLHFAIRTTFFFPHFIFQNIDYTLPCRVECCSGTVMACTCLSVAKWKRRGRPLDGVLPWCPFVGARQIAPPAALCAQVFLFFVCEHKINIPFDAGGNSVIPNLHTRNLKKRERERENWGD